MNCRFIVFWWYKALYIQTTACVITTWSCLIGGRAAFFPRPVKFVIFCLVESTEVAVKIAAKSCIKKYVEMVKGRRALPKPTGAVLWNSLPLDIRHSQNRTILISRANCNSRHSYFLSFTHGSLVFKAGPSSASSCTTVCYHCVSVKTWTVTNEWQSYFYTISSFWEPSLLSKKTKEGQLWKRDLKLLQINGLFNARRPLV